MSASGASMLPRTVASFYGTAVPRPYIMRDDLGTVVKDRVAAPRVNAALVEWARTQAWKRGGLLADEVARYAGRSAGAAGKRKLRDEEEDEDDDGEQLAIATAARSARRAAKAAARTTKKAATTAGPSGRGVLVRGTPARKKKALRRRAADDGEPEWDDAPDSESEEEVPAESSDNDEDALPDAGDARDDEDDDDDDAVPESPAPRRAVTPARGALVRLPPRALASAQRSRLASPVSLTQSQRTPSVAEPVRAFTPHAPHAPPRWRLKGTVRVPTEPSPHVRPDATPATRRSASTTPGGASAATPTPGKHLLKGKGPLSAAKVQAARRRRL